MGKYSPYSEIDNLSKLKIPEDQFFKKYYKSLIYNLT